MNLSPRQRGLGSLTLMAYQALIQGARVLSRDRHGDKVLLSPDGRVIKLFRRKHIASSTLWRPYALRFVKAAARLSDLGFRTVQVTAAFRVPSIHRDVVVYRYLQGRTLRDALAAEPQAREALLAGLPALLARLHACGVYFRANHMGNFLVDRSGDGEYHLIDISEATFRPGPLSMALRARNFKPLTRRREDAAALQAFGSSRFLNLYMEAADIRGATREAFSNAVGRHHPMWACEPWEWD